MLTCLLDQPLAVDHVPATVPALANETNVRVLGLRGPPAQQCRSLGVASAADLVHVEIEPAAVRKPVDRDGDLRDGARGEGQRGALESALRGQIIKPYRTRQAKLLRVRSDLWRILSNNQSKGRPLGDLRPMVVVADESAATREQMVKVLEVLRHGNQLSPELTPRINSDSDLPSRTVPYCTVPCRAVNLPGANLEHIERVVRCVDIDELWPARQVR